MSESEVAKLYTGYRNDEYFKQRHAVEPWYSRAINDGIGAEEEMSQRRGLMRALLEKAGLGGREYGTVVDWGGDRGQMLKDVPAKHKLVHEVSQVEPDPGVEKVGALSKVKGKADLVLNCHVLEHLNEPMTGLEESVSVLKKGAHLYLELPFEPWVGPFMPARMSKWWVTLLSKTKWPLMAADFFSTAARVKLHVVPPMGFVAVREHLSYFTIESVRRLIERAGLTPLLVEQPNAVTLVAIAQRN